MRSNQPEVIETEDHVLVADVLAEAFADDPFMAWLIPQDRMTPKDRLGFWELVTKGRSPNAVMHLTAGGDAGALWFEPVNLDGSAGDAPADADADEAMSAMADLLIGHLGDDAFARFGVFELMGEAHPKEPHWYLQSIGTRVTAQGQGRGAALMAPVLQDCDEKGLPCYLESSNPRNLSFYFRHGFEATDEIVTPGGEATMTCMWREPR